MRQGLFGAVALAALALASCGGDGGGGSAPPTGGTPTPVPPTPPPPSPPPTPTTSVTSSVVATLNDPWAMVFMPDGRLLVTEQGGNLRVVTQAGAVGPALTGVPAVAYNGQGGLLDVALDPAFASNNRVYISYSEPGGGGTAGTAVARGTLNIDANGAGGLTSVTVIWRQTPKVNDNRHYGARMAFGGDGKLYITAGERHQGAPAQDLGGTLGKIIRINADGTIPADNPFVATAGARTEIYSLGHRNPYGLVFGTDGRLFESEMGPDAGDEFNIIAAGANYGWRTVSEGSDGGVVLPKHSTWPDFAAPAKFWDPNIAPAGMIQYTGTRFVDWQGDFVLAGLVYLGLVQVRVSGSTATEVRRISLGQRIREVEQGPDGALWVLEDTGGRLLKLVPN